MFFGDIPTKSKTYQKEGWSILEAENRVFGSDAENAEKLDSEKNSSFYHKDKEDIQNNIEYSAKNLTDLFTSASKDVPDLTEEEINKGIERILEKTHPEEITTETANTKKTRKVTFRVLFVAALLSILSFSCIFVVGNSHDISIENGFVTFAKDTIKIVFFDEGEEEYITVDALLSDLENHGYSDILFPQEFITKSDEYKVSVPEYIEDVNNVGVNEQVSFDIYNDTRGYSFNIIKSDCTSSSDLSGGFMDVDDAETVIIGDVYIYVFEHDIGSSSIHFVDNGYSYYLTSEVSLSEMISIAQTIIKVEE